MCPPFSSRKKKATSPTKGTQHAPHDVEAANIEKPTGSYLASMYPLYSYRKEKVIDPPQGTQHIPQDVEAAQSTLDKTIPPFPSTIITAEPSASPSLVEEQNQMPAITQKLPSQVDETLETCPK